MYFKNYTTFEGNIKSELVDLERILIEHER